jgi:hypothetical protein
MSFQGYRNDKGNGANGDPGGGGFLFISRLIT